MTLKDWQQSGNFFRFQDYQIFYQKAGTGPTLLLLHGFPTASWDWNKLWQPLQSHFNVLAIDFLGFGFSDKPRQPYTIMQQADIVTAFLKDQHVVVYHLLAHDYGDTVAQELLARSNSITNENPSNLPQLLSLCLLNGGLFPETHKPLLIQRVLMSPLGAWVAKLFTKKRLKKNFDRIFGPATQPTARNIDDFWTLMVHNNGKQVFHLLIRYMQQRKEYRSRWVGALQQSVVSVRLINGASDPISGAHMMALYRQLIPEADVVSLAEIGHYPQIEAAPKVLQYYLDFYKNLKADKSNIL